MSDCIFCKIVKKEVPADIIYEDRDILGFDNIKREAPIHLLFIPKKHIEWSDDLENEKLFLFGSLMPIAKKIAKQKNIFDACKLIFNIGKTGHIPHIHLHLLGGWEEKIPMNNI